MTDAPKIDTQAPERIWAEVFKRDGTNTLTIAGDYRLSDSASVEYVRADLADARAAAVREAAWKSGYMIGARCTDKATYDAAYVEYCTSFPGNPDLAAALDRLIAERVREAVEAERDACAKEADETAREADLVADRHGRQVAERIASILRTRASRKGT